MTGVRRQWTRDELLVVFRLYCRTPFGRLHSRNPNIIDIAGRINRTPGAVGMKACNFASLDPHQRERAITALGNVSNADRALWDEFLRDSEAVAQAAEEAYARLLATDSLEMEREIAAPQGPTETESIVKIRRVQSFFRAAVLTAYGNRCALTGLAIPELLVASHIIPWSVDPRRRADPRNGICLNALHDRAFDRGLMTFDEQFQAVVSPDVADSATTPFTRAALVEIQGKPLSLPARFAPDPQAIEYHRESVFGACP